MAGQYSSRDFDRHRADGESADLPHVRGESRVFESDFVALRFATHRIDEKEVLTRLHLEARHPKVVGDARVFDLSSILAEGYRRHPGTVAQIIHPELSMETRLDALRTVAVHFAGLRDSLPPMNEPSFTTPSKRSLDGWEPSFAIKTVVLTEFGDALQGYARRAITVVRNEQPWVQFVIIENRDGLCDASMVVLPTGVELPLLDRSGHAVAEATLDETIHDFTHLLRKKRYEPELKALETLAAELTERLSRNPDAPRALKKRNFAHEVVLAARDGLLWAKEGPVTNADRGAKVSHNGFEARELPDGRVLWLSHRQRRMSSEITLVGESLEGGRYELSFLYPPQTHQRVSRIFGKVVNGKQWPDFTEMANLLHVVPRSAFAMILPSSKESYPSAVNSLMREIQRNSPEFSVERGLHREAFHKMDPYLPDCVSEFVMGRSPFFTVIDNGNPAESWHVQAFLDRELKGRVFAINALGGSIAVSHQRFPVSLEFRKAQLLKFFKTLAEDSSRIANNPNHETGLFEVRRNLPERLWNDALAYDVATRAASLCWNVLVQERCFSPQRSASEMRWHSQKLSDGVWSVALVAPGGRHGWLPSLINFTVTPDGVNEVSYSRGMRGIFGGLWGKRVLSESGSVLPDAHVSEIVRVIIRSSNGAQSGSESAAFRGISPDIRCTWLSSLRAVDPDREDHDMLRRVLNYFRNSW